MYSKIGRFKPGDTLTGNMNGNKNTIICKVLAIKKRRNNNHLYKIRYKGHNGFYKISQQMSFIDKHFDLSLKQIMKNL